MQARSSMLSSIAVLAHTAETENRWTRRTTLLQHLLNFLNIPIPETQIWETLENEPRTLAIEVLARLIVQATRANQKPEREHD
jgi:hypothetical protein